MAKLETLSDITGTNASAINANNDRLTAAAAPGIDTNIPGLLPWT